MKKLLYCGSLLAVVALAAPLLSAKELGDSPRWYVSPGVGMMFFEGNQGKDDGLNMVLRLGYDVSEHWSVEGGVSVAPYISGHGRKKRDRDGYRYDGYDYYYGDKQLGSQTIWGLHLDGLYHFNRYERWDPYLAAGLGYYRGQDQIFSEKSNRYAVGPRLGVGMYYHLNDKWSLRADYRIFVSLDHRTETIHTLDAGVAYRFGGGLGAGSGVGTGTAGLSKLTSLSTAAKDSDGDGLTDEEELRLGTDPFNADTDGDGLTDYEEVKIYGTDPLNPDTDFDGLTDYEEVKVYKTDPLKRDTDGGGVDDGHEVLIDGTNPLDPSDDLMLFEVYIQFDYDATLIKAQYYSELDQIIRVLLRNPQATALVEGHADRRVRSSEKYNLDLSERRAQAVQSYMVGKGVDVSRLTAKGYGFSRPKTQPDLVNGNPENRRVEVYIRGAGTNLDKAKYK